MEKGIIVAAAGLVFALSACGSGDPDASLILQVLKGPVDEGGVRQRPPGLSVDAAKVDALEAWIAAGAEDN